MDSSLELMRKPYAEELAKGPGANQPRIDELRESITALAARAGNAALAASSTTRQEVTRPNITSKDDPSWL